MITHDSFTALIVKLHEVQSIAKSLVSQITWNGLESSGRISTIDEGRLFFIASKAA